MNRRKGFTLVELVVVVLILGVVVAVAAPKLLSASGTATDNSLRQTLSTLRNAIELYAAEHAGALPTSSGNRLEVDLAGYLRGGDLPSSPVGAKNNGVAYGAESPLIGDPSPTTGWKYNRQTGEIIANSRARAHDGKTPYDQF